MSFEKNKYLYFYEILSEDEKKRANLFKYDDHREQWVASHAQMRIILAKYTEHQPKDIPLVQKSGEKPYIQDAHIEFNLSHSFEYGVLAVTNSGQIGIDIEVKRDIPNLERLCLSTFSVIENQSIKEVYDQERTDRFYNCWTRKEAFIKAIGLGFSYDTKSFSVDVVQEDKSYFIAFERQDYDPKSWNIMSFKPYPNTQAALVCDFSNFFTNHFELTRDDLLVKAMFDERTIVKY